MRRAGLALGSQLCRRWLHAAAATAAPTTDELIAAASHLPARVLDGRAMAAAWQEELAASVADVVARCGRPPGLGVVLVGTRPDSQLYVGRKREACEKVRAGAGVGAQGAHEEHGAATACMGSPLPPLGTTSTGRALRQAFPCRHS